MFIRYIDLSSIRKNPDGGRTHFQVAGKPYPLFGEGGQILGWERDLRNIYTLSPDPEWLYKYEPFDITCTYCRNTFPIEELKSDSWTDGEGDIFVEDICPICNLSGCTELPDRETLEKALERRRSLRALPFD